MEETPTTSSSGGSPPPAHPLLANLPPNNLSSFLEARVERYLEALGLPTHNNITIRVVSSVDKVGKRKALISERYGDTTEFPYREKVILVFQHQADESGSTHPVMLFGFITQEYYSSCPAPNTNTVYLAYVDSVNYFLPKQHRTGLYYQVLLGYLGWVRDLGLNRLFIWVCPPTKGTGTGDYLFNQHPPHMLIPTQRRLENWYKKMLQMGQQEGIVGTFENLSHHIAETISPPPTSVTEFPYFTGDHWPLRIESMIAEGKKTGGPMPLLLERGGTPTTPRRRLFSHNSSGDEDVDDNDTTDDSIDDDVDEPLPPPQKKKKKSRPRTPKKKKKSHGGRVDRLEHRLSLRLDELTRGVLQEMVDKANMFLVGTLLTGTDADGAGSAVSTDPDPPITALPILQDRDAFVDLCIQNGWTFDTLANAKATTFNILEMTMPLDRVEVIVCDGCDTPLMQEGPRFFKGDGTTTNSGDMCLPCGQTTPTTIGRVTFNQKGEVISGDKEGVVTYVGPLIRPPNRTRRLPAIPPPPSPPLTILDLNNNSLTTPNANHTQRRRLLLLQQQLSPTLTAFMQSGECGDRPFNRTTINNRRPCTCGFPRACPLLRSVWDHQLDSLRRCRRFGNCNCDLCILLVKEINAQRLAQNGCGP